MRSNLLQKTNLRLQAMKIPKMKVCYSHFSVSICLASCTLMSLEESKEEMDTTTIAEGEVSIKIEDMTGKQFVVVAAKSETVEHFKRRSQNDSCDSN